MTLSRNLKLVLLSLLIIIGISSYFLYSSNNYKVLSKREINDFIEDKRKSNLSILKEENVKSKADPHALILYKNDTKLGTYILTKNRQGIEEYNQSDFDFSSMCEIAFLLDIKDKNQKVMEKFLGLSGKNSTKIARSMERIEKGQAISNIKEFETAERFKVNQFWQRNK